MTNVENNIDAVSLIECRRPLNLSFLRMDPFRFHSLSRLH